MVSHPCPHVRSFLIVTSRVQVLFCSLVSGFDQIHLKSNLDRLEEAVQYGETAGDRCVSHSKRGEQEL